MGEYWEMAGVRIDYSHKPKILHFENRFTTTEWSSNMHPVSYKTSTSISPGLKSNKFYLKNNYFYLNLNTPQLINSSHYIKYLKNSSLYKLTIKYMDHIIKKNNKNLL